MSVRVHVLPIGGHLEVLKYLREEVKAPWDWKLPIGRLKMVISTYSNILLSVSMINIDVYACDGAAEDGHLDCLKYLHETAKAPWDDRAVRGAHRTTTPNVYNTSSTTTVLSQKAGRT